MGKRGPQREPAELTKAKGYARSTERMREAEEAPVPEKGMPVPATELSEGAQEVWEYTVEQLVYMGTLSMADRDMLVAYCEAIALLRRISKQLDEDPSLLTQGQKGKVRNPLLQMHRDTATLVRAYAREFGLTPASRSEVTPTRKDSGAPAGPERLLS